MSEPVAVVSLGPTPPAPRRRRAGVVAAVLVAAGVLAAAVLVPRWLVDPPPDLTEVRAYDGLDVDHTTGEVDYPQSPPVGGRHAPAWLECGVYDEPVREENAVHDLEHGAVWLSYRPGLGEDDVARLTDVLPDNGILAPYPGLAAPVVVTVWGRQLRLEGADDPRLELFLRRFGHSETAPEKGASCAGGTSDPQGGTSGEPGTVTA